jgi:uncharacterized protein YbjT (DUF2867 family)
MDGPVVVTGASGHVGRAVCRRLAATPNEVRAPDAGQDWAVAARGAGAVVHLAGTLAPVRPNTLERANLGTALRTARALEGSGVRRLVFLSYATADPGSRNEYLRAKGRAEELLAARVRRTVVLRSTFVFGPPDDPGPSFAPFLAREGRPVTLIGRGDQPMAPVFVDDVAEVVVRAALAPSAPTGTFGLGGPDVLTLDEMVALLNGTPPRTRHVPPSVARLLAHVVPTLSPALVDVLLAASLPPEPQAATAYGVRMHGPREVLGRR